MPIEERNIEIIDDRMAQIFREKTPQERLAIAFGMWKSAKMMVTGYLRSSHPDWDERKIHEEVVKRLSHGTIRLSQMPR